MPPISVLIKPASGKCNMRCKYCFYHDITDSREVGDYGFMTEETLEALITRVLKFAEGTATFSFQGGEPTLCGVSFFRRAVELQKKHNVNSVRIQNCIQTNGMLIDEEWAVFLHENRFLVGLSLDGTAQIHNLYRKDGGGKGTFARVMQTSALFDKHKVDYNILFVVTNNTARYPGTIYSFFMKHGFNFLQFIPCIDAAGVQHGETPYSLTPDRYAVFLKQFFSKWYADLISGKEVSVRYFDNLVRITMGMQPETCSMLGQCLCQFVFEADGSVYPCDFYVTDEWRLGSIHDMDIMELYGTETNARFMESSRDKSQKCADCVWKQLCRGGCRRDREDVPGGEPGLNRYCEAYKEFFTEAYPRILDLARRLNNGGLGT